MFSHPPAHQDLNYYHVEMTTHKKKTPSPTAKYFQSAVRPANAMTTLECIA